MPKPSSFHTIVADLERLLTELRGMGHLPQIAPFLSDLEAAVEKIRAYKVEQMAHQAASRRATRQLTEVLADGRYTASRIRSFLRGCLGHRNEELRRFGVAPSCKRGSRGASPPKTGAY